jgi:hypothetical protein
VIASRSFLNAANTVDNSCMLGAKAFCGMGVFVDCVASGGPVSPGACFDKDSEEKELVSFFAAVSLLFIDVDVELGATLTEAKRRSSSSRLRAHSFM